MNYFYLNKCLIWVKFLRKKPEKKPEKIIKFKLQVHLTETIKENSESAENIDDKIKINFNVKNLYLKFILIFKW